MQRRLRRNRVCSGSEIRIKGKPDFRYAFDRRVDRIVEIAEIKDEIVAYCGRKTIVQTARKTVRAIGNYLVVRLKNSA